MPGGRITVHACVMELIDTNRNPKMLFAAVYPAMAMDPKEFTEDCSNINSTSRYLTAKEYLP